MSTSQTSSSGTSSLPSIQTSTKQPTLSTEEGQNLSVNFSI
jgi:hypothetical protein